jgi:hypothetical protein
VVDRPSRRTADAASATGLEAARAAVEQPTPVARGAGSTDPLIGDLRRAGLLPLLVLHFTAREPAYGNQLIDRIESLTGGALHVNPNTMYPLLRSLEQQGFVPGDGDRPGGAAAAGRRAGAPAGPDRRLDRRDPHGARDLVLPPANPDPPGSAADHRLAASSTLEIPGGFLRICVLASRRQRPPRRAKAHGRKH